MTIFLKNIFLPKKYFTQAMIPNENMSSKIETPTNLISDVKKLDGLTSEELAKPENQDTLKKQLAESLKILDETKEERSRQMAIVDNNIKQIEDALAIETDPSRRQALEEMLATEKADRDHIQQKLKTWLDDVSIQTNADVQNLNTQITREYKTESISFEFDENGQISDKSLRLILSDFDGDWKAEVNNRGLFSRIFRGNFSAKNTHVSWEQQFFNSSGDISREWLESLYQSFMNEPLSITSNDLQKREYRVGWKDSYIYWTKLELNPQKVKQIRQFQQKVIQEVEQVSQLLKVITGNSSVETGLITVLDHGKDAQEVVLKQLQNNPTLLEDIQKRLASGNISGANIATWEKIVNFVIRAGVSGGLAIASQGLVQARMETSANSHNVDSRWGFDLSNMSHRINIGQKGSVVVNADIVWLTLEANINDHQAIISNAVLLFSRIENKQEALTKIIEYMSQFSKEGDNAEIIQQLTEEYANAQKQLMNLENLNPTQKQVQLDRMQFNTMIYASRVQQSRGFDFKGAYANAGLTGWALGLQTNATNVSATTQGVNEESGAIEAKINGERVLDDKRVAEKMANYNIKPNEKWNYVIDGTEIVAPDGKKIQWKLTEIYWVGSSILDISYKLVDESVAIPSKIVNIDLQNSLSRSEFVKENSAKMADFLLKTARGTKGFVEVQGLISNENYTEAANKFISVFKNSKDTMAKALVGELQSIQKEPNHSGALASFLDSLLAKTSGGRMSRGIADNILNGSDKKTVEQYYKDTKWLFEKFWDLYGLKATDVEAIIRIMSPSVSKSSVSKLGDHVQGGFLWLVAYSQRSGLRQLDKIRNSDAQIIGVPQEIMGNQANAIRNKFMENINARDLENIKQNNPALKDMNDQDIKKLMTQGAVKAYFSFEPDAECFNLGFIVEPGSIEIPWKQELVPVHNTLSRWSTLMRMQSESVTMGLGVGMKYKEEKKPKETEKSKKSDGPKESDKLTTDPKIDSSSTATTTAAEATKSGAEVATAATDVAVGTTAVNKMVSNITNNATRVDLGGISF